MSFAKTLKRKLDVYSPKLNANVDETIDAFLNENPDIQFDDDARLVLKLATLHYVPDLFSGAQKIRKLQHGNTFSFVDKRDFDIVSDLKLQCTNNNCTYHDVLPELVCSWYELEKYMPNVVVDTITEYL